MRTFDIMLIMISCRSSFFVAFDIVCHTYPTKPGLGSSHANSPSGPIVMYVGHGGEVPHIHPAWTKQGPKAMGTNGRQVPLTFSFFWYLCLCMCVYATCMCPERMLYA